MLPAVRGRSHIMSATVGSQPFSDFFNKGGGGAVSKFLIFSDKEGMGVRHILIFSDKGRGDKYE